MQREQWSFNVINTMAKKRTSKKPEEKSVDNPWPDKIRILQIKLKLKTKAKLAERLGISMETLRDWLYRGRVPSQMAQNFIDELLKNNP